MSQFESDEEDSDYSNEDTNAPQHRRQTRDIILEKYDFSHIVVD